MRSQGPGGRWKTSRNRWGMGLGKRAQKDRERENKMDVFPVLGVTTCAGPWVAPAGTTRSVLILIFLHRLFQCINGYRRQRRRRRH